MEMLRGRLAIYLRGGPEPEGDVPPWARKARRAIQAQGVDPTMAQHEIEVRHADHCPRILGLDQCDCDPAVRVRSQSVEGEPEEVPA